MKTLHYKYVAVLIICLTLTVFVSKTFAQTAPTDGSDGSSTPSIVPFVSGSNSTDTGVPAVDGSNTSSSTSIVPPIDGSNTSSSTSIVPPLFSSNDTGGNTSIATSTSTSTTPVPSTPVVSTGVVSSEQSGGYSSGGGSEYIPLAILSTTTQASSSLATLGSALSCPLLTDYIIPGKTNNPSDVSKLQIFLNVNDQAGLTVNGIFDTETINAVEAFQGKYLSQIMGPWGVVTPTGQVYITTLKKINSITCNTSLTLTAQDMAIINTYKANLAEGINGGNTTTVNNPSAIPTSLDTTFFPTATTSTTTSTTTTNNGNSALVGNAIGVTNNNFFSKVFSTIANWFKK
jgi:hypothetical protein